MKHREIKANTLISFLTRMLNNVDDSNRGKLFSLGSLSSIKSKQDVFQLSDLYRKKHLIANRICSCEYNSEYGLYTIVNNKRIAMSLFLETI